MANIKECEYAGIDPAIVERFERRVSKLLADMEKHGLNLFCGSSGSIRIKEHNKRDLIVGFFNGNNHDGGCGAAFPDMDGVLRGE